MNTEALEQAKRNTNNKEEALDQHETIDYKMVTFSLGGKDYGVDIMKVKEIAKFENYTYVPNAPPFVSGVYNLRGEIISLIDLRIMFNLPAKKNENGKPEDGLIARLEDRQVGVIVDKIDRVLGISSSEIQAPHPIFGDINIKYISGVVEHDGRLYIILDLEKILAKEAAESRVESGSGERQKIMSASEVRTEEKTQEPDEKLSLNFIGESLATFLSFYHSPVNSDWVSKRFSEWKSIKKDRGENIQIQSAEEAQEFLNTFYSPYTAAFWDEEYAEDFMTLAPDISKNIISVWNPGCGKGHETYSITCLLKKRYPNARIKIWANDNDLLNISTAPNLIFSLSKLPEIYREFTVEAKNGHSFSSEIKDSILFEYHDIRHANTIPEVDFIIARDLISFIKTDEQEKILDQFFEKLIPGAILLLGTNEEVIDQSRWELIQQGQITGYRKS